MPRSQQEMQFQSPGLQRSTDPNTFLSEVKYMIDLCDLQETYLFYMFWSFDTTIENGFFSDE